MYSRTALSTSGRTMPSSTSQEAIDPGIRRMRVLNVYLENVGYQFCILHRINASSDACCVCMAVSLSQVDTRRDGHVFPRISRGSNLI